MKNEQVNAIAFSPANATKLALKFDMMRRVVEAAESVLARDDADSMMALETAIRAYRRDVDPMPPKSAISPKVCPDCDEDTHLTGAPERVWCRRWCGSCRWRSGEWYVLKTRDDAVEYIRADVAKQNKAVAVHQALERVVEQVWQEHDNAREALEDK